MSVRRDRSKRRHSEAFPDDNDHPDDTQAQKVSPRSSPHHSSKSPRLEDEPVSLEPVHENGTPQEETVDNPEELARKQEIWEAFCEEQHEVLEQLPLSLHRSYALIKELDEQVNRYNAEILGSLKEYIAFRKSVDAASHPPVQPPADAPQEPVATVAEPAGEVFESGEPVNGVPESGEPPNGEPVNGEDQVMARPVPEPNQDVDMEPTAPVVPLDDSPEAFARNRERLTKVAQLSDEAIRTSREKLNIALFSCGVVDRYMRDLDRAIKEQEAALSIGLRPGTHPAHIILPEVVVPTMRAPKSSHGSWMSELDEFADEIKELLPIPPVSETPFAPEEPVEAAPPPPPTPPPPPPLPIAPARTKGHKRKGKKSHSRSRDEPKTGEKENSIVPSDPVAPLQDPPAPRRPSVKLTLPPPPPPLPPPELEQLPVNADEPLYCYCNRPSEGLMLGCDGIGCLIEWYHASCIGIARIPRGSWMCRECKEAKRKRK